MFRGFCKIGDRALLAAARLYNRSLLIHSCPMGFVEVDFLLFAGASHSVVVSFAKAFLAINFF
jgi:hypothetical protein